MKTFVNHPEAENARSVLEGHGIRATISAVDTDGAIGQWIVRTESFLLFVLNDESERALAILGEKSDAEVEHSSTELTDRDTPENLPQKSVGRRIVEKLAYVILMFVTVKRLMRRLADPFERPQPDRPSLPVDCEACGSTSVFPAELDGTTQKCAQCGAYVAVGDWDLDFDWSSVEPERDSPK